MTQQGDVVIYQGIDDGEISVNNGIVFMDGGLQTAVYLSLFGGNEDDNGLENNKLGWWGNIDEALPSRKYVSRTQNILQAIPATSANLLKVEQAIEKDLEWLLNDGIATSFDIELSIPSINKIDILLTIIRVESTQDLTFSANWKASI